MDLKNVLTRVNKISFTASMILLLHVWACFQLTGFTVHIHKRRYLCFVGSLVESGCDGWDSWGVDQWSCAPGWQRGDHGRLGCRGPPVWDCQTRAGCGNNTRLLFKPNTQNQIPLEIRMNFKEIAFGNYLIFKEELMYWTGNLLALYIAITLMVWVSLWLTQPLPNLCIMYPYEQRTVWGEL